GSALRRVLRTRRSHGWSGSGRLVLGERPFAVPEHDRDLVRARDARDVAFAELLVGDQLVHLVGLLHRVAREGGERLTVHARFPLGPSGGDLGLARLRGLGGGRQAAADRGALLRLGGAIVVLGAAGHADDALRA